VADPKACLATVFVHRKRCQRPRPCFVQRVHIRRRVPGVQASEHRASCQTGAWIARCRCRCRLPAPACRCRPGAHCCVFATSRRTVADPAATAAGRDRRLKRHGTDWRGLIRATNSHTEAWGLSCVPKHTGSGLDRAPVPVARFDAFAASVPFDLTTPQEVCSCRIRPCRQHPLPAR
jgi:hypothetical protein